MRYVTRKGFFGVPTLEICLAVVIAGIVIGAVAIRANTLLEEAEAKALQISLANLRSTLRLEKARRIVAGEDLAALAGSDPLALGVAAHETVTKVTNIYAPDSLYLLNSTESKWSFDPELGVLSYTPLRTRHLEHLLPGTANRLSWRIESTGASGDIELVSVTPYRWF